MNKCLSFLGLCMRAGKAAAGETAAYNAIKKGKANLIIVSEDASDNTKKKFRNSAEYHKVNIIFFGEKMELGHCLGKKEISVLAVCDAGFAEKILTFFEANNENL